MSGTPEGKRQVNRTDERILIGQARPARAVPPGLALAVLGVSALALTPVLYLAIRAAGASAEAWETVLRVDTLMLGVRTLGLAAAVTATCIAIGVPLAWLVVRTDLPGARVFAVLLALPLVVPSYVGAFAIQAWFGNDGLLAGALGLDQVPTISGFWGAWLALSLFTYPYVFLVTAAGLRGLDPALEEASRTLGSPRRDSFRRVTLPLLRPSIAAGGLLVALYVVHDFGAVSLMRFQTFTQAIFVQYRSAFDRTPAAILSLMLVAVALAILATEQRARGRARYFRTGAGASRRPRRLPLRRWRWPAFAAASAVALLALGMPTISLVDRFLAGVIDGIDPAPIARATVGAVSVSAAGAVLALVAAFPVALVSTRYPGALARAAERSSYVGYALPGLVVALAFVFLASNALPWLYQTLPLVVVAYVVLFLPQVTEPLRGALLQLSPRLEEAGRSLGRSKRTVFRAVTVPLVSRPMLAGLALVFVTAMKELPATLLLRPTGFETLATEVWSWASIGAYSQAAAPALLLIVVSAGPLYLLSRRLDVGRLQEVRPE
jgi:iron(III) transport system permease protein